MRIIPILLALGLAAGGSGAPVAAQGIEDGSLTIVAAPAFSGTLKPGQPLLISGTITNETRQTRSAGTAEVFLSASPISTPEGLSAWLELGDSRAATPGSSVATTTVGMIEPRQTVSFSVTVPAARIHLPRDRSGVYPLTVRLAGQDTQFDLDRSAVVWASAQAQHDINLSVISPLVTPPSSAGVLSESDLERLTAPGGILDAQLTTSQIHALTLAVDPRIIASIRLLGSSAPPNSRDWLTRLESVPTETFLLAYADADMLVQRQAGASEPLAPTSFPREQSQTPEQPEQTPQPDPSSGLAGNIAPPAPETIDSLPGSSGHLAWPAQSGILPEDLDFLSAGGFSRTLVHSSAIAGSTSSSPNVRVGQDRITVASDTISELLRSAARADTTARWAHAMAALTGVLSITAAAHPDATIVATLSRDGEGPGTMLHKTLTNLQSLSWVHPVSLSSAMSVPAARAGLAPFEPEPDHRVSTVTQLLASEEASAAFATVADDPSLVTGPQRLKLLALLSTSWQDRPLAWAAEADQFLADAADLRSSVHLPESSQITLLQEKGNLPITVRNELAFPVTVYVTVRPERAILNVLDGRVELAIEANSQAKASIPVQSIANGEVRTLVTLTSTAGKPISTPTSVVLNVQAGWETAATVVLAVLLVGLFAGGVARTIWRRRAARARLQRGSVS